MWVHVQKQTTVYVSQFLASSDCVTYKDGLCWSPTSTVERGQKVEEQIVIGTPGTVLDWCLKLKFIDPKKIKVFVLDEADVMIATQGHQDQSIRIQR